MIDIAALAGIAALIVVGVFFWKRFGIGSGRAFGNRVASHVGIPKGVFYLLLDNGVKGSTHDLLVSLQEANFDLDRAAVELGPTLARGIERLEEQAALGVRSWTRGPVGGGAAAPMSAASTRTGR